MTFVLFSSQEIVHSADEDGEMEEEEYTPLTCDMCSQTFNRPSDWVRHIEFTHADMTENRRKKRKVPYCEFFMMYTHAHARARTHTRDHEIKKMR